MSRETPHKGVSEILTRDTESCWMASHLRYRSCSTGGRRGVVKLIAQIARLIKPGTPRGVSWHD